MHAKICIDLLFILIISSPLCDIVTIDSGLPFESVLRSSTSRIISKPCITLPNRTCKLNLFLGHVLKDCFRVKLVCPKIISYPSKWGAGAVVL